jgi:hypothetical protein
LGGLRRATCPSCGARIGLSWLSSFGLVAFGTWIPVVGGFIGAGLGSHISEPMMLIGGALGLVVTAALFAVAYLRIAKFVED